MSFDTAETRYGGGAFTAQRLVEAQRIAAGESPDILIEPTDTADDITTDAYVNHGRWVVDCPFCSSAQFASTTERRFFCTGCRNVAVGGQWIKVRWPQQPGEIEEILAKRPAEQTRNWRRGEKVADLHDENAENLP